MNYILYIHPASGKGDTPLCPMEAVKGRMIRNHQHSDFRNNPCPPQIEKKPSLLVIWGYLMQNSSPAPYSKSAFNTKI